MTKITDEDLQTLIDGLNELRSLVDGLNTTKQCQDCGEKGCIVEENRPTEDLGCSVSPEGKLISNNEPEMCDHFQCTELLVEDGDRLKHLPVEPATVCRRLDHWNSDLAQKRCGSIVHEEPVERQEPPTGKCVASLGNMLCENGEDTYHQFNMKHSGRCHHCDPQPSREERVEKLIEKYTRLLEPMRSGPSGLSTSQAEKEAFKAGFIKGTLEKNV